MFLGAGGCAPGSGESRGLSGNEIGAEQKLAGRGHDLLQSFSEAPARKIGLRLVSYSYADGWPRIRGPGKDPEEFIFKQEAIETRMNDNAIRSGHRIVYKETIPVERGKQFFFVWPQDALGASIIGAFFTTSFLNGENRRFRRLMSRPAHYDSESRHWYVALSECWQGKINQVRESDIQILKLNLFLERSSAIAIEIQFRMFFINKIKEEEKNEPS